MKYIRKQKDPRGKVARWLVELENFEYRVKYVAGKDNVEADCLSRIEIPEGSNEPESIQEKACIYHPEEQTCVYFEDVILPTMTVTKHHQANDSAFFADAMKQLKEEGQVMVSSGTIQILQWMERYCGKVRGLSFLYRFSKSWAVSPRGGKHHLDAEISVLLEGNGKERHRLCQ